MHADFGVSVAHDAGTCCGTTASLRHHRPDPPRPRRDCGHGPRRQAVGLGPWSWAPASPSHDRPGQGGHAGGRRGLGRGARRRPGAIVRPGRCPGHLRARPASVEVGLPRPRAARCRGAHLGVEQALPTGSRRPARFSPCSTSRGAGRAAGPAPETPIPPSSLARRRAPWCRRPPRWRCSTRAGGRRAYRAGPPGRHPPGARRGQIALASFCQLGQASPATTTPCCSAGGSVALPVEPKVDLGSGCAPTEVGVAGMVTAVLHQSSR